jgi:putative transposase
MSAYRRRMIPGETYFFTLVTFGRRRIFESEQAVRILGDSLRFVRNDAPFRTTAMVVLPDHLHCIWSLPRGDADFSTRWKRIKREFTIRWIAVGGHCPDASVSTERRARGKRGVWQRRFWEHVVRDEQDLERLCEYIHYNPVKHGYSARPLDWPWSTFPRFVASGDYPPDWGRTVPTSIDQVSSIVGV